MCIVYVCVNKKGEKGGIGLRALCDAQDKGFKSTNHAFSFPYQCPGLIFWCCYLPITKGYIPDKTIELLLHTEMLQCEWSIKSCVVHIAEYPSSPLPTQSKPYPWSAESYWHVVITMDTRMEMASKQSTPLPTISEQLIIPSDLHMPYISNAWCRNHIGPPKYNHAAPICVRSEHVQPTTRLPRSLNKACQYLFSFRNVPCMWYVSAASSGLHIHLVGLMHWRSLHTLFSLSVMIVIYILPIHAITLRIRIKSISTRKAFMKHHLLGQSATYKWGEYGF